MANIERAVVGTLLTLSAAAWGRDSRLPLPSEARAAVRRLALAAEQKDLKAIRAAMIKEFTWSFGGDNDADQAVEEWRKDPRYLRQLGRVLRGRCNLRDRDHVDCPGGGGLSFRAGFVEVDAAWKLEFFVEGD